MHTEYCACFFMSDPHYLMTKLSDLNSPIDKKSQTDTAYTNHKHENMKQIKDRVVLDYNDYNMIQHPPPLFAGGVGS